MIQVELVVFVLAGAVCLAGAVGVVLSDNPVHAALSLVATLFGVAVLFVAQEAHFLAAVQVIVYAGAIVVLILFVLMLLGVDEVENLRIEPLVGQRVAAAVVSLGVLALIAGAFASTGYQVTGIPGAADAGVPDINRLGESLFTDYVYALEITSILLVIATIAAMLLARRAMGPEIVDPGQQERADDVAERMAAAEARAGGEVPPADADTDDATDEPSSTEEVSP